MTAEPMGLHDMETELNNAANMAEIACQMMEGAGHRTGKGYLVTAHEWNTLLFAVYHTSELVKTLQARWEQINDSNRTMSAEAAKVGAA